MANIFVCNRFGRPSDEQLAINSLCLRWHLNTPRPCTHRRITDGKTWGEFPKNGNLKIKTKIILSKKKNQYRIKYVFYRIIPLSNSLPILTLENVINFKQSLWTAVHSHQSRQAIAGMCMCGAILFRSPCHLHTDSALQATYTHTHTSTPSRVHHFCAHDEFFNKFRHMALVWLSE